MKKYRFLIILLTVILLSSSVFNGNLVFAQDEDVVYEIFLTMIHDGKPTTLNLGMEVVPEQLNPFFYKTDYERDIVNLTQTNLLTIDRQGLVVQNAIIGETRSFNGTSYTYKGAADVNIERYPDYPYATYTFTLAPNLKFPDGVSVSSDDLIFSLYTLLDPTYDGKIPINNLPIRGLRAYQTQVSDFYYDKYENFFEGIYGVGKEHIWTPSDPWTEDQQMDLWNRLDYAVQVEVGKIVDYVVTLYTDSYAESFIGFTPSQVYSEPGLQRAFAMVLWGFGGVDLQTKVLTSSSGKTWNLNHSYPSLYDFADEILIAYGNDYRAAFPVESVDGVDIYKKVKLDFIRNWGSLDPGMIGGIPNIEGIQRINQSTISIELDSFNPKDILSLNVPIVPLHFYGSLSKYNYAQNKFGFDFADLSSQKSKNEYPMGAGPYRFLSREMSACTLVANTAYFKGSPKINQIKITELPSSEVPASVANGNIDVGYFSYNQSTLSDIYNINSNGELSGNVITSAKVANMSYGYIGINARTVKASKDPSSIASRNLRKALATILAVHRKPGITLYYGIDGANTQEYPQGINSWTSPQPADPDYREAYSVNVNGNPIYSPGMTQSQKVEAAKQAALEFFVAAGYTIRNGKVVAAPTGAKMNYEIIIPGGGVGDHPAFSIIPRAKQNFAEIGITLSIIDPVDANDFWDALDSSTQELWVAALPVNISPDYSTFYLSTNTYDQPGSTRSNNYYLKDSQLDELIINSEYTIDQNIRKSMYYQMNDIILDWAVEIPTYNRNNFQIFSSQRLDKATIPSDLTPWWGWQNEIEKLVKN